MTARQENVTMTANSSSLFGFQDQGMKFDPSAFDVKNIIKFDFQLLQTALTYLVKTVDVLDKELSEMKKSQNGYERQIIVIKEEVQDFQANQSKKLEVKNMKKELEDSIVEKMVDYDDQIQQLKNELLKIKERRSKKSSTKVVQKVKKEQKLQSASSFNVDIEHREVNLLGSNLEEIKQNLAIQENSEDLISLQTYRQDNIQEIKEQYQQLNERVNDLNIRLSLGNMPADDIKVDNLNNITEFKLTKSNEPTPLEMFQTLINDLKQDFDKKYYKKADIRTLSKQDVNIIQNQNLNLMIKELQQQLTEFKETIDDKVNYEDYENLIAQIQSNQGELYGNTSNRDQEDGNEGFNSPIKRYLTNTNLNLVAKTFDNRTYGTPNSSNKIKGNTEAKSNQQQQDSQEAPEEQKSLAKGRPIKKADTKAGPIILPMAPEQKRESNVPRILVGGNSKEAKAIKDLQLKVAELEKTLLLVKQEQQKLQNEELKTQFQEITHLIDKKAGILDLKKNAAITDELNFKVQTCLKEMHDLKQCDVFLGEKGRTSAISLKNMEVKTEGYDQKIQKLNSSLLEVSAKVNDSIKLLMIGNKSSNNNTETDSFIEEKISKVVKEKSEYAVQELQKIKSDLIKAMKELETKITLKINRDELDSLDDHLSQSLDQVMSTCNKKFAEKVELRRLMRDIEQQLKSIQDSGHRGGSKSVGERSESPQLNNANQESMAQQEGEVMLATKPLGGWSCGSCGTMIGQLNNHVSKEFNVWGKLPVRDMTILNQKMNNIGGMKSFQKVNYKSQSNDNSMLTIQPKNSHILSSMSKPNKTKKMKMNVDNINGKGAVTERRRDLSPFSIGVDYVEKQEGFIATTVPYHSTQFVIQEERPSSSTSQSQNAQRSTSLPRIMNIKQQNQDTLINE